jgi:predicted ABC-type ATPase
MPSLNILAGPNGVGKTRISEFLLKQNFFSSKPFILDFLNDAAISNLDYNLYGIEKKIALEIDRLFRTECENAIVNNQDFTYECNFRRDQLKYVQLFEDANYDLNLIYIFLDLVEHSIKRVEYRHKYQNGNFIDKDSIVNNFNEGLENLDLSYLEFNNFYLIDNSIDFYDEKEINFEIVLQIHNKEILFLKENFPPDYLKPYLPKMTDHLRNTV